MTQVPMTDTDCEKLATMLQTFFPNRVPTATAKTWLRSFAYRQPVDVGRGIQLMAEQSEYPTLKGLIDAVREVVRERAEVEAAEKDAQVKLVEAGIASTVNTGANVRLLGMLVAAIKRGDSAAEIEAMVSAELAKRGDE